MNICKDPDAQAVHTFDMPSFNIKSKLYCSDPCYEYDDNNALNALTGLYNVQAALFKSDVDLEDRMYDIKAIELQQVIRPLMVDNDAAFAMDTIGTYSWSWSDKNLNSLQEVHEYYINKVDKKYVPYINTHFEQIYKFVDEAEPQLNTSKKDPVRWKLYFVRDSFQLYDYEVASISDAITTQPYSEKTEKRITKYLNKLYEQYNGLTYARTLYLHIKHESVDTYTSHESDKWEVTNFLLVDSGQLSFIDADFYKSVPDDGDYFDRIKDLTVKHRVGVNEHGVTVGTAYGDLPINLYTIKDKSGNIVEAIYHFLVEDD